MPFVVFPVNGTQRRDSSKFCSTFWVTDSERVIDDHHTQPISMAMEKWKVKKVVDGILERQDMAVSRHERLMP